MTVRCQRFLCSALPVPASRCMAVILTPCPCLQIAEVGASALCAYIDSAAMCDSATAAPELVLSQQTLVWVLQSSSPETQAGLVGRLLQTPAQPLSAHALRYLPPALTTQSGLVAFELLLQEVHDLSVQGAASECSRVSLLQLFLDFLHQCGATRPRRGLLVPGATRLLLVV